MDRRWTKSDKKSSRAFIAGELKINEYKKMSHACIMKKYTLSIPCLYQFSAELFIAFMVHIYIYLQIKLIQMHKKQLSIITFSCNNRHLIIINVKTMYIISKCLHDLYINYAIINSSFRFHNDLVFVT